MSESGGRGRGRARLFEQYRELQRHPGSQPVESDVTTPTPITEAAAPSSETGAAAYAPSLRLPSSLKSHHPEQASAAAPTSEAGAAAGTSETVTVGLSSRMARLRKLAEAAKAKSAQALDTSPEAAPLPLISTPAESSSAQIPAVTPAQVPKSVGRGRSSLIAMTKRIREESASGVGSSSVARNGASSVPESVHSESTITKGISELSLQEEPPVKMHGTSGETVPASTNYIALTTDPGKGVFEYEVRFSPSVDAIKFRYQLLNSHMQDLGRVKTFDGVTLYLPIKLRQQTTEFACQHPADGSNVTMTIAYRRQKRLGECVHLYNVLFRRIMQVLEYAHLGRQHFNPLAAHKIPQHKLEIWPGYVTAVDEYEGGVHLCCDTSHRVLRQQTALECIYDISAHTANFREEANKLLLGSSVLTRYNNRIYRVDDISWDLNPTKTFTSALGEEVTFVDYYKRQYNLVINDLEQPLMISRIKKSDRSQNKGDESERLICLIPELCHMTGLTDQMRSDFRVMKDIGVYTRITPNQRVAALKKFVDNIEKSPKARQLLADWGLKLAPSVVEIPVRTLPSEVIIFGKNANCIVSPQADWNSLTSRNNVFHAIDLSNWVLVYTNRDTRFASEFSAMMSQVGSQLGIVINAPKMRALKDDRTDSYLRSLRENIQPEVQVVVTICPTVREDRYSSIKRLTCIEKPVASQVIHSLTLSKRDKLRQVVLKIALQINCKLGGSLWSVKIPLGNVMFCGIDVCHTKNIGGKNVAAFVASMNRSLTVWKSQVCMQGNREELINGLAVCFLAALKQYKETNGVFPEGIIIFRDGVGDGQLNIVRDFEVRQLVGVFRYIGPEYEPYLTVVVCQKRINTRIFAAEKGGQFSNPMPGTVLDHTVTRRNLYDFFLVSQHVRQGTVSPTHYIVVHNTSRFSPDQIQRLTYKLCHMYYNWPGTVRVPAPCQYAHKLAFLVGQNLREAHSPVLENRLFFL